MTESFQPRVVAVITSTAAALALAACGGADDRTIGRKIDDTLKAAEQRTREAATDSKAAARRAADAVEATAKDVEITTKINVAIGRDTALNAISINVDTDAGKVALKGTAPTADARDRAAQIANAVQGVVAVDNQLTVSPRS